MGKKIRLGILGFVILAGLVAVLTLLLTPKPAVTQISDYQISQKLAVNQPSYYPVQQTLDPQYYRPIAQWIGLHLPSCRRPGFESHAHNLAFYCQNLVYFVRRKGRK